MLMLVRLDTVATKLFSEFKAWLRLVTVSQVCIIVHGPKPILRSLSGDRILSNICSWIKYYLLYLSESFRSACGHPVKPLFLNWRMRELFSIYHSECNNQTTIGKVWYTCFIEHFVLIPIAVEWVFFFAVEMLRHATCWLQWI
jgi:hypothetical protein